MEAIASTSKMSNALKWYDFRTGLLVDKPTDTKLQVVMDDDLTEICDVCKNPEKDHKMYGQFFKTSWSKAHYFCMLLADGMTQSNKGDRTGILGFERRDILQIRQKIADKKCCYCNGTSANLRCIHEGCNKRFHLVCGFKNKCQFNFVDFVAYCEDHITINHCRTVNFENYEECYICWEVIEEYHPLDCVLPDCCTFGWLHRRCLQKFTDSAGMSIQCLLCAEKKQFTEQIKREGIFVPHREATWEFEDRYVDIDKMKCTAEKCHMGKSQLNFLKCYACGNKVGHSKCLGVSKEQSKKYACEKCLNNTFLQHVPEPNSQ